MPDAASHGKFRAIGDYEWVCLIGNERSGKKITVSNPGSNRIVGLPGK